MPSNSQPQEQGRWSTEGVYLASKEEVRNALGPAAGVAAGSWKDVVWPVVLCFLHILKRGPFIFCFEETLIEKQLDV